MNGPARSFLGQKKLLTETLMQDSNRMHLCCDPPELLAHQRGAPAPYSRPPSSPGPCPQSPPYPCSPPPLLPPAPARPRLCSARWLQLKRGVRMVWLSCRIADLFKGVRPSMRVLTEVSQAGQRRGLQRGIVRERLTGSHCHPLDTVQHQDVVVTLCRRA